ncbi:hypothetical protein [Halorubrum sp. N11]|uniref:hypothetical protein n=1 Tax=Halorubrum sp. N11 TaxID=3402276 RepID=UPI003EB858E5
MGLGAFSSSAAAAQEDRGKAKGEFVELEPNITTDEDGVVTSFSVSGEVSVEYKRLGMDARNIALLIVVENPNDAESPGGYFLPQKRFRVNEVDSLGPRAGEVSWEFGPYDIFGNSEWEPSDFEEGKTTPVKFVCTGAVRLGERGENGGTKKLYERENLTVRP